MEWKIAVFTPGDHIRVKRDHYFHHGIYVGGGEVIHYTGPNNDAVNSPESVLVRKTSIQFFLKDGVGEKAIYTHKEQKRLNSREKVLQIANESLGKGGYNLINNNCEHFAINATFNKLKKEKLPFNFLHFIGRFFIKFTGFFAFWIYVKPKHYYSSLKAKKEANNLKDGAIIIANHTSIFDYYIFIFKYLFKVIHSLVAEVVYEIKGMRGLNNVLENIEVNRNDHTGIKSYLKAKKYLMHNKTVLIFPEGHLEKEKGVIEEFSSSVITLSFETNKPIIPSFMLGNYGLFKRAKYITGEKIDVRKLVRKEQLSNEDIDMVKQYIYGVMKKLKHQLDCYETHKTHCLVSKKTYVQDFMKITSFPIGYLLLRARKIYLGDKKEIRKAMKEKVILAPNHTSMYDVIFMYLYFFSRRLRIIALNNIWDVKILGWAFNRSGVIKYNRDSSGGFDIKCYKEANGILEANGALTIFPQGHISKGGVIDTEIKGGTAMFSLRNNAPIIPIIFADETAFIKSNRIVIGDVIWSSTYYGENPHITSELVEEYSHIINKKMLELQEKSKQFSRNKKVKEEKICSQK